MGSEDLGWMDEYKVGDREGAGGTQICHCSLSLVGFLTKVLMGFQVS